MQFQNNDDNDTMTFHEIEIDATLTAFIHVIVRA